MERKAGDLAGAADTLRHALRLKPDYAAAHYSLGRALVAQGKLTEGIEAYRRAIRWKPGFAEAHCNLGLALEQTGPLTMALKALRRGHELGAARPDWTYTSAKWVAHCESLLALEKRLPAFLKGDVVPDSAAQALRVAEVCLTQRRYADACRFFQARFQRKPPTLKAVLMGDRYRAACAAVQAAAGQGKGAPRSEPERARLRGQAFKWLTDDLRQWPGLLAGTGPMIYARVMEPLKRWQTAPALATVRDAGALDCLPGTEAQRWREFWDRVAAVLGKATAKLPAAE
jgi:tetratricopeptide (TPR) repeat protein